VPGQPAAIAALPATQKAPDGIALAAMGGGPAAPAVGAGVNVNWGKLPPRLAKDFLASRSENVPPEYRAMVDNYFKAVAEKARAK
jgi:hypothetical protein